MLEDKREDIDFINLINLIKFIYSAENQHGYAHAGFGVVEGVGVAEGTGVGEAGDDFYVGEGEAGCAGGFVDSFLGGPGLEQEGDVVRGDESSLGLRQELMADSHQLWARRLYIHAYGSHARRCGKYTLACRVGERVDRAVRCLRYPRGAVGMVEQFSLLSRYLSDKAQRSGTLSGATPLAVGLGQGLSEYRKHIYTEISIAGR